MEVSDATTGNVYFWNSTTDETAWELPKGVYINHVRRCSRMYEGDEQDGATQNEKDEDSDADKHGTPFIVLILDSG